MKAYMIFLQCFRNSYTIAAKTQAEKIFPDLDLYFLLLRSK